MVLSMLRCAAQISLQAAVATIALTVSSQVNTAFAEAGAAQRTSSGKVAIEVRGGAGAPPWLAGALQEHLARELSTYERLSVAHRSESPRGACGQDRACLLRKYRDAGVHVVLLATARADELGYALYETWTPSKVGEGALTFERVGSLIGLRQALLRVFGPVLRPGGLLDQMPYRVEPERRIRLLTRTVSTRDILLTLVVLGLFFLMPVAWAAGVVNDRKQVRAERWPLTWVAAAAFIGAAAVVRPGVMGAGLGTLEPGTWWLGLIGGAAWGIFAVSNVPLLVPALPGLERVAHRSVFRLLRAWLVVCVTRCLWLGAYYTPFIWGLWFAAGRTVVSSEAMVMLVGPAVGIGARLWLSGWIRGVALYLDQRLANGVATPENLWHREVSRYFTGYLRRNGWALDPDFLASILFLPGRGPGIHCYGGGSTPARIVIDEPTLALAIGAATEARPAEETSIAWVDWAAGLMPHPAGAASTRERNKHRLAPTPLVRRVELMSATGHLRKQLGQAGTLLGYVRAEPGELVPLIADTVDDLEVVRSLLSEHYQWFAPDPDEDHDDTDPTDKDFLFGVLTYAIGNVVRRDSQLATFSLALTYGPLWLRWLGWLVRAGGVFSRRSAEVVADAYPALHFARHHHLQYMAYRLTDDDAHLTVRASAGALEQLSTKILRQLRARLADGVKNSALQARLQRRMVWSSSFFQAPLVDRGAIRRRRLSTVAAVLALCGGFGASVFQAMQYHPIYVERIAEQERRFRQQQQQAQEDEGSNVKRTDSPN